MCDDIKCHDKLGKGEYGIVYNTTNKGIACKKFVDYIDGFLEIQFYVLLNLNKINQNYIKLHYIEFKHGTNSTFVEFNKSIAIKHDNKKLQSKVSMYIDKFDCNLKHVKLLSNHFKIDNRLIMFYIFKSYDNLYQNFIIHGDLKLDNILIKKMLNMFGSKIYRPYICDFGLSVTHINNLPGSYESDELNYIQTINYRAPEFLFGNCNFDYKVDIWSIGIIMMKLYNKLDKSILDCCDKNRQISALFSFFGNENVIDYLESENIKFNKKNNKNNKHLKHLIINNLNHDNDPQVIDLINKLLELNPKNRINMREIFDHPYFTDYGLKYQFNERNAIKFLNDYFDLNGIKYHDISKINNILPRHTRFTMYNKLCKFIKFAKIVSPKFITIQINYELLFRTIHLFDIFLVKSNKIYMYHEYIYILHILLHLVYNYKTAFDYDISSKYAIDFVKNEQNKMITKVNADNMFHDLILILNFVISTPTYLNYLPEISNFNNHQSKYNVLDEIDMWKLMLYIMADINHYKYHKFDLIKFMFDLTCSPLPANYQYNVLFNNLLDDITSYVKLNKITTDNINSILHH